MTQYTNPFHAIEEAIALLESYGANPDQAGSTFPKNVESIPKWPENVLGINVDKIYSGSTHFYRISIQLNETGFKEVVGLIDQNVHDIAKVTRASFDTIEFDELSIEPSSQLKLFCLTSKES